MDEKAMRVVFGEELILLGKQYPQMVVLDSDTSSSTQTKIFAQAYPNRFFNCGIAEGNMLGMAGGMAAAGLIPITAAFAFLVALRAGDDVRSLIAYNHLNVKMAGCYCGLSDFADGASHQTVEDMGIMRTIPGIAILSPSDIESTKGMMKAMMEYNGPVYIRLSRQGVTQIYPDNTQFEIGKANRIREGKSVTVAVTGSPLHIALEAAEILGKEGIEVEVLDYLTVKPFDKITLLESVKKTGALVTVEEHSIYGGLGSSAAEVLSEQYPIPMKRVGIEDCFGESGSYSVLLEKYGISTKNIITQIKKILEIKKGAVK